MTEGYEPDILNNYIVHLYFSMHSMLCFVILLGSHYSDCGPKDVCKDLFNYIEKTVKGQH